MNNKIVIGIILLVFGLLLAFLGAKFFWISIIALLCVIFILILFIIYFIFQALIGFGGATWVVITIVVVGLALGIAIGLCLKQMTTLFFIGIGGFFGYTLAIILYNSFLNRINSNPQVVYWVTIGVLILIGCILGYKFLKVLLIITTSFFGSYISVRAVSIWAGGFPSETIVMDLISKQEWKELEKVLTGVVYAYLGCWLVMAVGSSWYQFHANKDLTDDDLRGKKREEE